MGINVFQVITDNNGNRNNGSTSTAYIIEGLRYAIEKKADVINMSLGGRVQKPKSRLSL